ncbi:MAG: hypothetical protein IPN47_27680 [Gemmatimonadetes bacterium]|jgi:hypothetical protein|nr:hypothetical protein [Gemmatimonadota bacterium]
MRVGRLPYIRLLPLVAAVAAACDEPTSDSRPTVAIEVATDRAEYDRGANLNAAGPLVSIRNRGQHSVYVALCGETGAAAGLRIERDDGAGWVDQGLPSGHCALSEAVGTKELFPGDQLSSRFVFVHAGRFRFRVPLGRVGGTAMDTSVTSNAFSVR